MQETDEISGDYEPGIPWQEKLLLGLLSALLIFLPWAIGAMHVWSQLTAAGLAAACLLVALLPRPAEPLIPGIKKLLRFPVFYAGLLLLAYVAVQGFNPAWKYIELAGRWYMIPIPEHIHWLPSGTDTAFEKANPFRYLLIFSIPFFTACALWCGLTRRKSIFFLLLMLVLNGFALAGLGLLQLFSGADRIFWTVEHSANHTVASFIYRNHAAAFFNLIIGISGGLALHYFQQARLLMKRSDPSGIFLFVCVVLFIVVVLSLSRAGVVMATVTILSLFCFFFFLTMVQKSTPAHKGLAVFVMSMVVAFGAYVANHVDYERLIDRFDRLTAVDSHAWEVRWNTATKTADMFADNWVYGWGAGSFRWIFPSYQARDGSGGGSWWEFAHNDLIQYPAELGVVGMGLVLLMLGYFWWQLADRRTLGNPLVLFILVALGVTVAHGVVDFPFQNPAVLTVWCALWVMAAMLVRMERAAEPRQRRRKRSLARMLFRSPRP